MTSSFRLKSSDWRDGGSIASTFLYPACGGGNRSPALAWSDAPAGTSSFAVTIHDPDAPRPGGWWHWVVFDIPAKATGLPSGPDGRGLPTGAKTARNDFGQAAYGGPCPPPGPPHRYVVTVWALNVEHLKGDSSSSSAEMARQIQAHALGKSQITGLYGR